MRRRPVVKFRKLSPEAREPTLATDGSSGYDLYVLTVLDVETKAVISNLEESIEILPGESAYFGTGIAMEIPPHLQAVVPSRTGLAVKHNIEVGYYGAIVDSDFRGELTILLRNLGKEIFKVRKFMKAAQIVFQPRIMVEWVEVDELSQTERGEGSHGHTGVY